MVASPRIVTVDPTGTLPRIVRAAADLLDRPVILVDMPGSQEALAEIKSSSCKLLVTAVELDNDMKGIQLALQVRRDSPDTHAIILADSDDPDLDEETLSQSPFVYLRRPIDVHQFIRVLLAGLDSGDIFEALKQPAGDALPAVDMGPVPNIDREVARTVIDGLLTDVGAMAIILSSRSGEVLLERGAVGYVDREKLTQALLPMINTTVDMSNLVGGRASTIQFYDGEDYDVFVLSVGLHHFLCIVMDGQAGNRQFGAVNRFGRRAAEDLIALLGAAAFIIQKPTPVEEPARKSKRKTQAVAVEEPDDDFVPIERPEIKAKEPEPFQLDPIENLDFSIFDNLDNLDVENADDVFDPDKLAAMASGNPHRDGPIDFGQAQELGIIPKLE